MRANSKITLAWAALLLCGALHAQTLGSTSCTTLVRNEDCTRASAAFVNSRDNKLFNAVDVVISDTWEFKKQQSLTNDARAKQFAQKETGLLGPTALLAGNDQDYVLIFFEKHPVAHITKIVVSIEAFYKSDLNPDGKVSEKTHFDPETAFSLAEKINGYVVGWTFGQMANL